MSKSNIEILLSEWGAWKRGENRNPLGYPRASAFQNMRVDGRRKSDPYALLIDDDLRKLDSLMPGLHADYRVVLMAHYIKEGPVKAKAYALKTSVRIYYTILEHAHKALAYQMGGRYETGFEPKLCAHIESACAQM